MTDNGEEIDDEIFRQLPRAYQILIEFARERGIIEKGKKKDKDAEST